ncbi:MAG: MurR/RpiR family transcriptional regulator [Mycobacteriales bacterium]
MSRPPEASFLADLRAAVAGRPPAQAAIGATLLADPAAAAGLEITELAARAGVSASTVTRFCRAIGLDGYPQMRLRLAAAASRLEPARARLTGDVHPDDGVAAIIAKIAGAGARDIEDTAERLHAGVVATVVERIVAAPRVRTFGAGTSGLVAQYLQTKLDSLGIAATAYANAHTARMAAAQSRPGDVVVVVSAGGRTGDGCDVVEVAAAYGATTVAITGNGRSRLAGLADLVLLTVDTASSFRAGALRSRSTGILVADCVCAAVAVRTYDASAAALQRIEQLPRERATGRRRQLHYGNGEALVPSD